MMQNRFCIGAVVFLLLLQLIVKAGGDVSYSCIPLNVKVGDENTAIFNSPIFSDGNDIYVAFVRRDTLNTNVYQTIVGKYSSGSWTYSVIEPRTLFDPYHAQPSIGLDEEGYIHVVYNMHSSPWQYNVSKRPRDISEWIFRGQALNGPHDDITSSYGFYKAQAAIPGLRITYAGIHPDRNGALYIAYRELAYYKRPYLQCQASLGIARYDVKSRTWSRVGKNPDIDTCAVTCTFATEAQEKWTFGGKIFFDPGNRMHVSWCWYRTYEDSLCDIKPNWHSYTFSDDGGASFYRADGAPYTLPIHIAAADTIVSPSWVEINGQPNTGGYFYEYSEITATSKRLPLVEIFPRNPPSGKGRAISVYQKSTGWSIPNRTPYGATIFTINNNNELYAVSSGLRIHKSDDLGKTWSTWDVDLTNSPYSSWMDYSYTPKKNQLRFLACDAKGWLKVYTADFSNTSLTPFNGVAAVPQITFSIHRTGDVLKVSFVMVEPGRASLSIYDIHGKKLLNLFDRQLEAGTHRLAWLKKDKIFNMISEGIYIMELNVEKEKVGKTFAVIR
jgi:hypothetical protein